MRRNSTHVAVSVNGTSALSCHRGDPDCVGRRDCAPVYIPWIALAAGVLMLVVVASYRLNVHARTHPVAPITVAGRPAAVSGVTCRLAALHQADRAPGSDWTVHEPPHDPATA
jgi:hypothetical protein